MLAAIFCLAYSVIYKLETFTYKSRFLGSLERSDSCLETEARAAKQWHSLNTTSHLVHKVSLSSCPASFAHFITYWFLLNIVEYKSVLVQNNEDLHSNNSRRGIKKGSDTQLERPKSKINSKFQTWMMG